MFKINVAHINDDGKRMVCHYIRFNSFWVTYERFQKRLTNKTHIVVHVSEVLE